MAITKLGKELLLRKYAARWHDFIGKLSDDSIKLLHRDKLIKPLEEYIAGIRKGNENILRRTNFSATDLHGTKTPTRPWYGASTEIDNNLIRNDIKSYDAPKLVSKEDIALWGDPATHYKAPRLTDKLDQDLWHARATRHEVNEALAAQKARDFIAKDPRKAAYRALNNYIKCGPAGIVEPLKKNQLLREAWVANKIKNPDINLVMKRPAKLIANGMDGTYPPQRGVLGANHANIEVLLKDRKLRERFPYTDNPAMVLDKAMRTSSGELQYIDALGRYGDPKINPNKLERFSKKNERELRKNWGQEVTGIQDATGEIGDLKIGRRTALKPLY